MTGKYYASSRILGCDDDRSESYIVMSISPRVAIGLFNKSYSDKYPDFKEERIILIEDDDTLKYMHRCAFQFEYVMNENFLVSPSRNELEYFWNTEKEKRSRLKTLREQLLESMNCFDENT